MPVAAVNSGSFVLMKSVQGMLPARTLMVTSDFCGACSALPAAKTMDAEMISTIRRMVRDFFIVNSFC
jgi:hypothetical protein